MKRVRVEWFGVAVTIELLPCITIWKWHKVGFFWLKWGIIVRLEGDSK